MERGAQRREGAEQQHQRTCQGQRQSKASLAIHGANPGESTDHGGTSWVHIPQDSHQVKLPTG